MVQATSSNVWCVVLDGTGFLDSRKRNHTMNSRPSTNRVMIVMIGIRITLWRKSIFSASSVAGACRPMPLSCGAPRTGALSWARAGIADRASPTAAAATDQILDCVIFSFPFLPLFRTVMSVSVPDHPVPTGSAAGQLR